MRMDPFKILFLISIIISSSCVTITFQTVTTGDQREVYPEVPKKTFLWDDPKDEWNEPRWKEETRDWAWERVSRFVRMLQNWEELQADHTNWKLEGGKADVTDKPRSPHLRNPRIKLDDRGPIQ